VVATPRQVSAEAGLSISPPSGTYTVGESFSILVNVNSDGHDINAASGQLKFDSLRLEVVGIGTTRSIFTIWTEEPKFSNSVGTIQFSGGLPSPGFNGSNGTILRITFKALEEGKASISFTNGSLLANDGQGTNILETFSGASYTITDSLMPAQKIISTPTFTEWPKSIAETSALTVRGLGYPDGKLMIYVQKNIEDLFVTELVAGSDGRFSFTYPGDLRPGVYQMWAKNVTADGTLSGSSDVIAVSVNQPYFLRIGGWAIDYMSMVIILGILTVFILILLLVVWLLWHVRQKKKNIKITKAERVVHDGFDRLRIGFRKYVSKILQSKLGPRQQENTVDEIDRGLTKVEKEITEDIDSLEK